VADRFSQLNESAWRVGCGERHPYLLTLIEADEAPVFTPFKAASGATKA
jgi:hypothetical protein